MATAGLLVGWNDPRTGRESEAAELYASSIAYYMSKVKDGTIDSFEPVLLQRHGGDLNGFIIVRGEAEKLDAMRRSEEFQDIVIKGTMYVSGFGVVDIYLGEELQSRMAKWMELIPR